MSHSGVLPRRAGRNPQPGDSIGHEAGMPGATPGRITDDRIEVGRIAPALVEVGR